ncbi:DUF6716 putative glycosyltransferase [Synechococcus sp. M16CYN]|uniref:DUF6716 putative glycosyltransferase n=1 Tax=Synechococcus sp. M16CYN TaxID=3103139 RepID=UPI0032459ECC
MTIVLACDGVLEQYSCHRFADDWRRQGRRCLVVGPQLLGHQPLPCRNCDVTLRPTELLGSTVLEQASAIGLFLHNPDEIEAIANGYKNYRKSQGLKSVPVFSGPLIPLMGDGLVDAFLKRFSCDLIIVSGNQQIAQLRSITTHWPTNWRIPKILATGFWFPREASASQANQPLLVALIQDNIPTYLGAKQRLLQLLERWATDQPGWTVVLQRDQSWAVDETIASNKGNSPVNIIEAAPEQMLRLLGRCTACLSVSSPWSLVAMMWRRIPLVIGDYGIQAEQQTTNFFGCGTMHRLRDIKGLNAVHNLPLVNEGWLDNMGGAIKDGSNRLLALLDTWKNK